MLNPFSLEGKNIIITGASSGIGRQCAIDCSVAGARVALIGRNINGLNETKAQMFGDNHQVFVYDLDDMSKIKQLITSIVETIGKVDGFIHSAGVEITKPIQLLTENDYISVYRTNVLSALEIVSQLSSVKYQNSNGSIVFISSISAVIGRKCLTSYAASKGALISACRTLALEFAHKGTRVNCVSPGTILTPLMKDYLNGLDETDKEKRLNGFPLGLGQPTDISNACVYLLSDASRWITGQNLIVDGGYTCQ